MLVKWIALMNLLVYVSLFGRNSAYFWRMMCDINGFGQEKVAPHWLIDSASTWKL